MSSQASTSESASALSSAGEPSDSVTKEKVAMADDPHWFDRKNPTEVTRLLNEDARERKTTAEEAEEGKKKMFSWMWKFGLVSCILVLIVAAIAIAAVLVTNRRENILEGCVNEGLYDMEIDYFPDKIMDLGVGLNFEYFRHYKTVRVNNGQRYILYQCGTPEPTGYVASRYFAVPLVTSATYDQRPLNFLEVCPLPPIS